MRFMTCSVDHEGFVLWKVEGGEKIVSDSDGIKEIHGTEWKNMCQQSKGVKREMFYFSLNAA